MTSAHDVMPDVPRLPEATRKRAAELEAFGLDVLLMAAQQVLGNSEATTVNISCKDPEKNFLSARYALQLEVQGGTLKGLSLVLAHFEANRIPLNLPASLAAVGS